MAGITFDIPFKQFCSLLDKGEQRVQQLMKKKSNVFKRDIDFIVLVDDDLKKQSFFSENAIITYYSYKRNCRKKK